MIAFPLDSTEVGLGSDGLPTYNNEYTAQQLRDVFRQYFGDGVFASDEGPYLVRAGTEMGVTVSPGSCMVQGAVCVETEETEVAVPAAHEALGRVDTVALRLDLGVDALRAEIVLLQGTPSATPEHPALTRDATVWEMGLADVSVPAGATSVSAAQVTDTRPDPDRCGWSAPYATLDTTGFFTQLQAATDEAVEAMKDALDETTAGHLQSQIDEAKRLRPENEIPSGTDLDTLTEPGSWYTDESGSTFPNAPAEVTESFLLYVYEGGGS